MGGGDVVSGRLKTPVPLVLAPLLFAAAPMPATGLNPAGRRRARKATAAAHLQGHEPEESRKRKRSDRGTPQLSATPSRDDTAASSTDGLDASAVPACRQLMSSPAACAAFHERQSRGAARAALGERMRVSTFIKVSRKEKIDDQKVGDPVLGKLYVSVCVPSPFPPSLSYPLPHAQASRTETETCSM